MIIKYIESKATAHQARGRIDQTLYQVDNRLTVWRSIGLQRVLEPDRWLGERVKMILNVPWQPRRCLSVDQATVHHCDVVAFADR